MATDNVIRFPSSRDSAARDLDVDFEPIGDIADAVPDVADLPDVALPTDAPDPFGRDDDADGNRDDQGDGPGGAGTPVSDGDGDDDGDRPDTDALPVPVDLPETDPRVVSGTVVTHHGETIEGVPAWASRPAVARPAVPVWVTNRDQRRHVTRWVRRRVRHVTAFHAARVPLYGARLAGYSLRGTGRGVVAWGRWAFDREATELRAHAVEKRDVAAYAMLSRQRNTRVRSRVIGSLLGGGAGAALVGATSVLSPDLAAAWAAAGIGLTAWHGRPADRAFIVDRTVTPNHVAKLTSGVVTKALGSIGLPALRAVCESNTLAFAAPITRDGPGWRAEIDLPHGVTATDVIERRDRLASGLRRPLGCVWPEPVSEEHTGRLVLWVGDADLSKTKQAAWPLLKSGSADLFVSLPFGTDQRGRIVGVTLMFASMVIGAIPRMGKTFALRLLLLAACLDPRVELHVYDLKGTGDLSALAPVSHAYRAGDDEDDIAYLLADLRELSADLRRRTAVIRDLPRSLCPENKITPELASMKQYRLHPVVFALDECQRAYEHEQHGKEIEALCEDLVKRGPAVGIALIAATQRPDAKSLPTGISSNAVARFCLKVTGQVENDMVLGTSAYKNGVRATVLSRQDRGVGYLVGEGDDPQVVRTYYVDGPAAEAVAARARALREAAGTITGHAAGTAPAAIESSADTLLDDLSAVSAGEDAMWSETAITRLADLRPDDTRYAEWSAALSSDDAKRRTWAVTQVGAALKPHGVKTRQISRRGESGEQINRRGFDRSSILDAITQRNQKRSESAAN